MIIAIDFDGTLVVDEFPKIGRLRENAKEVVNLLCNEGYYIVIWTCRTGMRLTEAIDFLNAQGIRFHAVNESHPGNISAYGGIDTRKIFADVYIEDKCVFHQHDWMKIYAAIHLKFDRYEGIW